MNAPSSEGARAHSGIRRWWTSPPRWSSGWPVPDLWLFGNPTRLVRFLAGPLILSRLVDADTNPSTLITWMIEAEPIRREIEDRLRKAQFRGALQPGGAPSRDSGPILYALVRAIRPSFVVETGVASGVSTYNVLAALSANGHGELYSIDLPLMDSEDPDHRNFDGLGLPIGQRPGWLVPDALQNRWHLELGSSRELLPKLLSKLGRIQFFIHDSEHTYENMAFEYQTSWKHLDHGGLLVSDDISANSAFADFVRSSKHPVASVGALGFVRKVSSHEEIVHPFTTEPHDP